jgi:hypothetical protein
MPIDLISPELIAAAKSTATPIALKAVKDLATRVADTLSASLTKSMRDVAVNLSTNFGPHLATTYDRCTKLKTLVSPDEPAVLLDQYVNLRFKCNGKEYDDYQTIEEIRSRKRVIISGTGGGGKTIFTKYLWISFFENPRGQIPIFFELRRVNDIQTDNLLTLIYFTIVETHSKLSKETFDKGVASGLFIFILDGFDEVVKDRKDSTEKQILDLARNNPECTLVVSGRPDDTFDAWQSFSNFTVQPLSKPQVVDLIKKLTFDKAIKRKFIRRLNIDLYDKHQSFLSTPLLASLMLLTFNQFADIPEKIHLFYEQAFDTLFARHDAMKEAFKRDMHANLSVDVFKKYFSYFCLVSYFDSKIEFTPPEIKRYIKRGLKIENAKVDTDKFLKDLQESVCVIQREGLNLIFTHRTFQEFFAAYCLARLSKKHFSPIVEKVANRWSDNVLKMLHDMNDGLLETEYLLPAASALLQKFDSSKGPFLRKYVQDDLLVIIYRRGDPQPRFQHNDTVIIRGNLRELFPVDYKAITDKFPRYRRKDRISLEPLFKKIEKEHPKLTAATIRVSIDEDGHAVATIPINGKGIKLDANWFASCGFADYAKDNMELVQKLTQKLTEKTNRRDTTIESIFGIDDD